MTSDRFRSQKFFYPSRGFTLIEMILVVTLMSVIGLAIYQAISNGVDIWEYGRRFSAEEDVAIFLEKLDEDISQSFEYSLIKFTGRQARVTFPTMVSVIPDRNSSEIKNSYIQQIGRVEYDFDPLKKTIVRREANYSQALKGRFGSERIIVSKVKAVRFTYLFLDKGKVHTRGLADEQFPSAVRVEVEYPEQSGEIRTVKRTINIPAKGLI